MVFYSLGSALGAITTTTLYDRAGWGTVSLAGAGYAAAALALWGVDQLIQRRPAAKTSRNSNLAPTHGVLR